MFCACDFGFNMASAIGTVPTFDPNLSSFEKWTEIVEEWCVAKDVSDDEKRNTLFF